VKNFWTPSPPRHIDSCRFANRSRDRDRGTRDTRVSGEIGGTRSRHDGRAITYGRGCEETPLIPDRSADASRSLRFADNTRAAAVGGRQPSARGYERSRSRPRSHEAARARPKRQPVRVGPIFLRRRRSQKKRKKKSQSLYRGRRLERGLLVSSPSLA